MRRAVLSAVAVAFAAAALLITGIAAAAISPTYNVTGLGSAANSTESRLVGTGNGSSGDRLPWRADLEHTALSRIRRRPRRSPAARSSPTSRGGGSSQLGGVVHGRDDHLRRRAVVARNVR